jgi:HEAT repeat protein
MQMSEQKLFDSALVLLKREAGDPGDPDRKPSGDSDSTVRIPLHWLSDLDSNQTAEMARLWRRLPVEVRRDLMARMEEEARENFELDFLAVARIALNDADAEVRVHAIRSFWECGDSKLVDKFLQLMEQDPEVSVQAAAASALGPFVERAELEEIPASVGGRITARLIAVIRGKSDMEIRRRAVESVGYSSDPQVRAVLENAHSHSEERMRASALLAMGRSADPSFSAIVIDELRNSSPMLRAEAARAAGALGLRKSIPQLIDLLEDVDPDVRGCAIDALGELGGDPARNALDKLQQQASGEEWDRIETALENAEFQDSLGELPLLELDEMEEEIEDDEDEEGEEDAD